MAFPQPHGIALELMALHHLAGAVKVPDRLEHLEMLIHQTLEVDPSPFADSLDLGLELFLVLSTHQLGEQHGERRADDDRQDHGQEPDRDRLNRPLRPFFGHGGDSRLVLRAHARACSGHPLSGFSPGARAGQAANTTPFRPRPSRRGEHDALRPACALVDPGPEPRDLLRRKGRILAPLRERRHLHVFHLTGHEAEERALGALPGDHGGESALAALREGFAARDPEARPSACRPRDRPCRIARGSASPRGRSRWPPPASRAGPPPVPLPESQEGSSPASLRRLRQHSTKGSTARVSAIVAHAVAAAEIHWSRPWGKPLSK